MSTTQPLKPNRTPWIIAGVLGCLAVCLLIVVAGMGIALVSGVFTLPSATPLVVIKQTPLVPSPTPLLVTKPTLPPLQPSPTLPAPPPIAPPPGQPSPTLAATASPIVPTPTVLPPSPPPSAPRARLAFTVRRGDRNEDNSIWVMNADGSGAKELIKRASEPTFSPDGKRIAYYLWTDGLFVANADGTEPKKIVGEKHSGFPAWSNDGRWIALSVRPGASGNIATDAIAPDGTGRRPIGIGWSPSWSPDDKFIVFQTCRGAQCGIFRISSAGGDAVPISTDDGGLPAWSPDGKRILYQKDVDGVKQLFVMDADGSNKKQLTRGNVLNVSANWSPDGNFIFYRSPQGGQWGIWRMNADGSNPVRIANDMPPGDWPYDRIAVTRAP